MKTSLITLLLILQVTIGFAQSVYSGKAEKVFHLPGCKLLKKDLILYSVNEATNAGLTPCKTCSPLIQRQGLTSEVGKRQEVASGVNTKKEILVADSLYYPNRDRILVFGEPNVLSRKFESVKQNESVAVTKKLENDWVAIIYKGTRYYCQMTSLIPSREYANQLKGSPGNNTPPASSPTYTPSNSSYTPSQTIRTGPRGGQYYINKNGNKTYIKRK